MSAPDLNRSTSLGAAMQSLLLWTRDFGLSALSVALLLGVATAGWTGSFIGLHDYAVAHMQFTTDEAWLVPLAFDGAAFGLSIASARAAMYGRSAIGSRMLVVCFTGLSSWINWLHINDPQGRVVAALLPPAAVVLFEAVLAEMRAASERRSGRIRPRLHPLRWIVAPTGTWEIYRGWILEIPLPQGLADSMESARRGDSMESGPRGDSMESPGAPPRTTVAGPNAAPPRAGRPDRPRGTTSAQVTPVGIGREHAQPSTGGLGVLARISGLGRQMRRPDRPDPTEPVEPDRASPGLAPVRPDSTRPDLPRTTGPVGSDQDDPTRSTAPSGIHQSGLAPAPDPAERRSGIEDNLSQDDPVHSPNGDPTRLDQTLAPRPDSNAPDEADLQGHGPGMVHDSPALTASSGAHGGGAQPGVRPCGARQPGDSAEQHPWLDIASRWGLDRAMLQIALDADAAALRKRKKPAGRDKILGALKDKGYAIGATGAQNYQNAIADGRGIQDGAGDTSVAGPGERIDEYV